MTDFEEVFPKTEEEMLALMREAVSMDYDPDQPGDGYSKSADSMWKAALVAFNYASYLNGATGFQESWAELTFLQKSRRIKCPFAIWKAEDLLYPQYDLRGRFEEWIDSPDTRDWLRSEAKILLAEKDKDYVSPSVWAHWEMLAKED